MQYVTWIQDTSYILHQDQAFVIPLETDPSKWKNMRRAVLLPELGTFGIIDWKALEREWYLCSAYNTTVEINLLV